MVVDGTCAACRDVQQVFELIDKVRGCCYNLQLDWAGATCQSCGHYQCSFSSIVKMVLKK